MSRRERRLEEILASVNHRLVLLDAASHRIALIENVNDRLAELEDRLRQSADSAETIGQLVRNIDQALTVIAQRLDAIEAGLTMTRDR